MTRKRKKRAAPRVKRRREPIELEQPIEPPTPAEEWSEVVDSFREMLQLESKTARRHALRLMLALEREALAIFKVARRLEDPSATPKDYDKLRAHHARSAIVDRLRQDFSEKHVALAHLDDLYERFRPPVEALVPAGQHDLGPRREPAHTPGAIRVAAW